ncbi:hypothetical protein [Flagellimonas halotolerans]|uniref:Uncharacterized protein n=1 Tax=Flagellimonas halotolerans TaxID=3112164 RepID=A0ABU6IUQ9_9FLAO|nr:MULTISPECIES: hypothetical protein [unclassified Allomuricauda]MEC3966989.1 hypothetical protein [Muricauda sp. SYSU M86414]MEC4266852.1 hypothetical protein [Muricauda sp. SYSU M84420]
MEKKPVKVRLVGRNGRNYNIQFPYLHIPVTVNETLYRRMLKSSDYQFDSGVEKFKEQGVSN